MTISIIAAMAANRTIGKDNKIPWKISGEQKRFRALTLGKPVIMRRKTHESIGAALPGRMNIVVTKNRNYSSSGCVTADCLDSALELCHGYEEVLIGGGEQLYQMALPVVHTIYLTVVYQEFEGDTFFPEFPLDEFAMEHSEDVDGNIPYTYYTYVRIGKGPGHRR